MRKIDVLRFRFVMKFKESVRNEVHSLSIPDKEAALVNKKR